MSLNSSGFVKKGCYMGGMLFEGLYVCWRMIEGDVGKMHPKIIPKIIIHPFKFKMF